MIYFSLPNTCDPCKYFKTSMYESERKEHRHLEPIQVKRKRQRFMPDSSRVITRFFGPGGQDRQKKIIQRIVSLSDEKVEEVL